MAGNETAVHCELTAPTGFQKTSETPETPLHLPLVQTLQVKYVPGLIISSLRGGPNFSEGVHI